MIRHHGRLVGALVACALLLLPASALSHTSSTIAQTGGMTVTLPILGSPLSVALTLDPSGNISQVELDPAGTFTATKLGPHAVTFANAADGVQVKIKAKNDKLSITAAAGSLANLLGPGTWSADVFGTGASSTVAYTVSETSGGDPNLTIDSVSVPSGSDITFEQHPTDVSLSDEGSEASAWLDFSFNGYLKRLKIAVEVDATGGAHLKIELKGKDRQILQDSLENLMGAHAWNGRLCDGTAVAVNYNVTADGTAVLDSATGAPATAQAAGHGFKVVFDGTDTWVRVRLMQHDGAYVLRVDGHTGRCGHHVEPVPTVNTPVAPDATASQLHDSDPEGQGRDSKPEGEHQ